VDASTGKITLFAGNYTCCYAGTGTGGDGGPATAATLSTRMAWRWMGGKRIFHRPGGERRQRRSAEWTQSSRSHTPRDHRREDPHLGRRPSPPGFSGDGGPPLQAVFGGNINIAAGSDGSLYIADQYNNRVRKVDPAGATINTVVGNGQTRLSGDGGPATAAGRAICTVGRVGRGGEPLHRILQLRAEGHFQRHHRPLCRQRPAVWFLRRWRTRDGRID
jgi:hypothetical protein